MTRTDLKLWAKNKIKDNFLQLVGATLITVILTSLTYVNYNWDKGFATHSYSFGWIFYFVSVGYAYYMVNYIKGNKCEIQDIFRFSGDFVRCLLACLLQALFVILWALLLIVPGIIKLIAYQLVPYLLADEKYKDMRLMDVLNKSEEMMNGHKSDYFILGLSFIGWHILAIFTLGLLEIWILPYQQTAFAKFLSDIKDEYEGNNKSKKVKGNVCAECGAKVSASDEYCSTCGKKLK